MLDNSDIFEFEGTVVHARQVIGILRKMNTGLTVDAIDMKFLINWCDLSVRYLDRLDEYCQSMKRGMDEEFMALHNQSINAMAESVS